MPMSLSAATSLGLAASARCKAAFNVSPRDRSAEETGAIEATSAKASADALKATHRERMRKRPELSSVKAPARQTGAASRRSDREYGRGRFRDRNMRSVLVEPAHGQVGLGAIWRRRWRKHCRSNHRAALTVLERYRRLL